LRFRERAVVVRGVCPRVPLRVVRTASLGREFFIDNLLVRIRFIIEMMIPDRPCAMAVSISFFR